MKEDPDCRKDKLIHLGKITVGDVTHDLWLCLDCGLKIYLNPKTPEGDKLTDLEIKNSKLWDNREFSKRLESKIENIDVERKTPCSECKQCIGASSTPFCPDRKLQEWREYNSKEVQ